MVFTPFPPRFVTRYSSISERFPYPFSDTTKTWVFIVSAQTIPTTSSCSSFNVTPRTPDAFLPIGRTLASGKRIARPLFKAIMISLVPLVIFASNSSSPSLTVIALIPFWRGREYASNDVFLIVPLLVHIIMKLLLM